MLNALSPQGRFFFGLAILTADGLLSLTAICFVLGGECWRFAPILAPSVATDETGALFNAYAEEVAENDKSHAAQRQRVSTAIANIALKEPDPKQDRVFAVAMLQAASTGGGAEQASNNQYLLQKYQGKLREAFEKKIAETDRYARAHERDGWLLSILGSIVVLVISWAVARAGIRLLRSAALPGTVFEKPSQGE